MVVTSHPLDPPVDRQPTLSSIHPSKYLVGLARVAEVVIGSPGGAVAPYWLRCWCATNKDLCWIVGLPIYYI